MSNQKYWSDILVRLAHHSSAIEGNTISLPETVSIIVEGTMPGGHKSIREFFEVENHKKAFQLLTFALDEDQALTPTLILDFHKALTDRLQHDSGQFKTFRNAIVGADFETADPLQVPQLINQWVDNVNFRLKSAHSSVEAVQVLADTHIQFERIHPFSDGNGRTGRLILCMLSMQYLEFPIIVEKVDRGAYIEALAAQDVAALSALFQDKLDKEKRRKEAFSSIQHTDTP